MCKQQCSNCTCKRSENNSIMSRMKENYEKRSATYLTRRTPVIIRLDGKTFSSYTKNLDKPFDEGFIEDMQQTAVYLCEEIQGAKLAYVQSDEISILLGDYDSLQTQAWFDYNVQKMTSISASLATAKFNQLRTKRDYYSQTEVVGCEHLHEFEPNWSMANFDSRVFNIPKEEVANYFLARQQDAVKNSISMLAQSLYSHSELQGKSSNERQELCFQKGVNWNDLHWSKKRGSIVVKNTYINDVKIEEKNYYEDGDLWYQPDSKGLYEDPRGRLLVYSETEEEWFDIPIESIVSKWEVEDLNESFNNDFIKKFI